MFIEITRSLRSIWPLCSLFAIQFNDHKDVVWEWMAAVVSFSTKETVIIMGVPLTKKSFQLDLSTLLHQRSIGEYVGSHDSHSTTTGWPQHCSTAVWGLILSPWLQFEFNHQHHRHHLRSTTIDPHLSQPASQPDSESRR